MSDAECPYCGEYVEIDHDDGYGYDEGKLYEQECHHCEKVFGYSTSISFYYNTFKADCLNGGEHDWHPACIFPEIYGAGKYKCHKCDAEKIEKEERLQWVKDNYASFEYDWEKKAADKILEESKNV